MNFSISTRNIPPYKVNQPSSHPNNNKNLFPFSADIRCKISLKILKISVFSIKERNRKKQTNYRSAYQPLPLLLHQPHPLHPQRFFFYFKARNRSCCSSKENLARPLYPQRRTSRPIMDSPHSSNTKVANTRQG